MHKNGKLPVTPSSIELIKYLLYISLQQIFPEDGIKIVSATLHSHVAGRKMKLRHVRDGIELERIVEDDNYDFNYQQVRQLANETVVLPGDYMITDCAYEVRCLFI